MNTHHLLLCAMFLVLMINITRSQGNDDLYSNCGNLFNCGSIQGIGYPFWGESRSSSCGYPALELACEDNAASIMISNVKYKVLSVYLDSEVEVLQIAREDFSAGICSPDFVNTTLDPALFSLINGYVNSTFIYGCPNLPKPNVPSQFSCTIRGIANKIGYVAPGAVGPGSCFKSVVVPISLQWDNRSASLEKVGQQGFEVRLGVDFAACKGCANSKGVCGYDILKNTTACYCADGSSGSATCAPSAAGGPQGQPGSKGTHAFLKS
ncbi:Protein kinase domain-containing protein [Psidium guajava]|nr:Protein kinase domain-containing protein [Psidium guajava]